MSLIALTLAASMLPASQSVAPQVGDYFPLVPGTRWTYEERSGRIAATSRDEVLEPVDVGGRPAFPIRTTVEGRVVDTRYYRIEGDQVVIVAFDPKAPLEVPQPVLRVGSGRTQWAFAGRIPFMGGPVPLELSGTSVPRGRRKVLGEDREVIEVSIDANFENDANTRLISRQTAIYAKGVGLVEMTERRTISRTTTETRYRLIRFEPPS